MALTYRATSDPTAHPILSGLRFVPGSAWLVLGRLVFTLLAALPGQIMIISKLMSNAARRPYYTDGLPLDVNRMVALGDDLPRLLWPVLLTTLLALVGEQVLVAGGLGWLDLHRTGSAPSRHPVPQILGLGSRWLLPMFRVLLVSAVLLGALIFALRAGFVWLELRLAAWGASQHAQTVLLRGAQVIAYVLAGATVGALAHNLRTILILDGRRYVRRAFVLALSLLVRAPVAGLGVFVTISVASTLCSSLVLFEWRMSPPHTLVGAGVWIGGWLLVQLAAAVGYHWVLHTSVQLYAGAKLALLRREPDGPLYLIAALRRSLRWVFRRR